MNRILKQRARQLYKGSFGRTFAAYLVCLIYWVGPTLLPQLFQQWLTREAFDPRGAYLATLALQTVLLILLMPIGLGVSRYDYLLQKDQAPRVREALYYFTSPGRYGKGVAAGLMISFPVYLISFCTFLQDGIESNGGWAVLALVTIAVWIFYIYWTFHASLVRYILVEDEQVRLGHARRESFRLMKGNCGRYFLLELSFIGWYLLLILVLSIVMMVILVPLVMDMALEGDPFLYMEGTLFPAMAVGEVVTYLCITFLYPYIGLANAGFGDAALQGRLSELEWQGRMPAYGGAYYSGWQQPPYPPAYPPQEPYPPYPPQPQYPPQQPQGGPWQQQGMPPRQNTTSWQEPPQAWGQPVYTDAQQEEALQYSRYCQGQPMEPKSFSSCGDVEDLSAFRPWMQVERSGLYSFLKLESWMPGMVSAVWEQALGELSGGAGGPGAVVKRSLEESLSGTRFRVTAIVSGYPTRPGLYKVYINIDLNPQN